ETTLDIDERTKPDIIGSMTELGDIGPFEIVFSCHSLEHLHRHEVPKALQEFYRVLVPDGCVVICVPDLEGIVANDEPLAMTQAGPISGLDMIYGHGPDVEVSQHMAHHSGFIAVTLAPALRRAGFVEVVTRRVPPMDL